jgi:plastocyanin
VKNNLLVFLSIIFLLTACAGKTSPNPTGTLHPINTTAPTNTLSIEPAVDATTPAASSGKVDAAISGFAFAPASLTIKVGNTVTWTNQDGATYDVKADNDSWGSDDLQKGDTSSFTFTRAGTYSYRCGFHAKMKADVVVVE